MDTPTQGGLQPPRISFGTCSHVGTPTPALRDEDHGLAKLQGTGPLLADSKMDSPSAGLILGVCLGVWIYIYMDLSEGSGITKCKGQGNGGLH